MGHNDRGLGVVIRDANGSLLAVGVRRSKSLWSVDMAEAYAAKFGIELAVRLGYSRIHLEGDALNIISKIATGCEGASPIFLIYDSLFSLLESVSHFNISFVCRGVNTLAHSVARWDVGNATERVSMELFLQGLSTLAGLDLI
ncbi:unnamed protein product [Amaranthus hypochondriacus]